MGPAADVVVVGSGLAGLAAALALAARDVPVSLIGPQVDAAATARDTRSTALFGPSLALLRRVGAFDGLESGAEPLVALRLVDDTDAIFRAPEVLFEAREIGEAAFGLNIENGPLLVALAERVKAHPLIRWTPTSVYALELEEERVVLHLASGETTEARLIVGADGAQSPSRAAAGITTRTWEYPQVAIASRFAHERPHRGISTELHRRAGPLTTVPLPGNWSSLVWVETPAEAERLMALSDADFARELETRLGSLVGAVGAVGPRASFPISGVAAERLGARRIALVGEAGHRLPPIGAQGLNLGLRDVAWLADLVGEAVAEGRDPGSTAVLDAYDRARRADVGSRAVVVDALNRSLLAGLLPIDLARGAGLAAMKAIGPVRRIFMREGMSPTGPLPSLMQPLCETEACVSRLA
jgi:2-octaprenyl-6-methoxyphenol hydroxylase